MTDAEVTDAALAVAEKLVMAVPEGTSNMIATTAMAVALGVSLYNSPTTDREAAINVMCDIIRQAARGERAH